MANPAWGAALLGLGSLSWIAGVDVTGGVLSGAWSFVISAGLIVLGLAALR